MNTGVSFSSIHRICYLLVFLSPLAFPSMCGIYIPNSIAWSCWFFRRLPRKPKVLAVLKSFPVPSPARTRDGRVEPPERLRSSSSSARVKGGHHVFGECPQAARLLASSPPCSRRELLFVFVGWSARLLFFTASSGTTTTTCIMFGASGSTARYNHFTRLVNYMISITILLVSVNYMMVMIYSDNNMYHVSLVSTILISMVIFHLNKHIYDIISILFISLLRIKLNLNLPIFLTTPLT